MRLLPIPKAAQSLLAMQVNRGGESLTIGIARLPTHSAVTAFRDAVDILREDPDRLVYGHRQTADVHDLAE